MTLTIYHDGSDNNFISTGSLFWDDGESVVESGNQLQKDIVLMNYRQSWQNLSWYIFFYEIYQILDTNCIQSFEK